MRHLKLVGALAFALVFSSGAQASPEDFERAIATRGSPALQCKWGYLKKLGWKISDAASVDFSTNGGFPCDDASIEKAHERRVFQLPASGAVDDRSWSEFEAKLETAFNHPGNFCAYKLLYEKAAKRATARMHGNTAVHGMSTGLQFGTGQSSRGQAFCHIDSPAWKPSKSLLCTTAALTPSAAVECFYTAECVMECAAGRQSAELAVLYELFGPADFDQAFQPEEINVGTWGAVQSAARHPNYQRSWAQSDPEYLSDDYGRQSLIGIGGYLGNIKGERYLDSPANRGENYVIIDTSSRAAAALKSEGMDGVNQRLKKVWDLFQGEPIEVRADSGKKVKFNRRLPADRVQALRNPSTPAIPDTYKGMEREEIYFRELAVQEALNSAFLRDTVVYVFPIGPMTLREHVIRQLEINPRTPYRLRFDNEQANLNHYTRFRAHFTRGCGTNP